MTTPVNVIVLHQDTAPVLATLLPDPDRDGHLKAMQSIVDGLVSCVGNFDGRGTDLWCNDEGLYTKPLNRVIPAPAQPPPPPGFDVIYMDEGLARPGEPGEWRIHGDFFIARVDDEGNLASVTPEDIAYYEDLFARIDAMKAMGEAVALLKQRPDVIARGECMPYPVGCGGLKGEFRDELSAKEYELSGLCQSCQDQFFDELSGGDVVELQAACPICKQPVAFSVGGYAPAHADPTGDEPCTGTGEKTVPVASGEDDAHPDD